MSRARVTPRVTAVAAVAVLALTGCGNAVEGLAEGAVERALENELGETADVEIDEDSFTVDTEEGSTTVGAGSVPEDFPADIPLVEGEVSFSQRVDTADGSAWTVVITTPADPETVTGAIRGDLESNGFSVEEASEFSSDAAAGGSVLAQKDDLEAFILIAGEGAQTSVTYTVNQQPSGS